MVKDVLVSISGVQMADGEDSDVEMITAGNYYQKDGKHYILFDEAVEGMNGKIRNTIKITADQLEIIKHGLTNVHMVFQAGKKTQTNYVTPFGEMAVGLNTEKVEVEEEENNIRVRVVYSLDINYSLMTVCRIAVDIRPRKGADLKLT